MSVARPFLKLFLRPREVDLALCSDTHTLSFILAFPSDNRLTHLNKPHSYVITDTPESVTSSGHVSPFCFPW